MATHNLKTWIPFYQDVIDGRKTFELRKNDRDYQVGDTLTLIEVDPRNELAATGRQTNKEVIYLLAGWGLEEGYVVLAIK
ncbi:MAG: ASCH/PUA domain-containing protein [Nostoc sp.]|uniref:ASCH/PUA domain-containing protein n=1 Tax=Nostoc sp. TaxID=1180 RepID=UPI002FF575D3